jgi:hypothetical protein
LARMVFGETRWVVTDVPLRLGRRVVRAWWAGTAGVGP